MYICMYTHQQTVQMHKRKTRTPTTIQHPKHKIPTTPETAVTQKLHFNKKTKAQRTHLKR